MTQQKNPVQTDSLRGTIQAAGRPALPNYSTEPPPHVEAVGLNKSFGSLHVLKNVSLKLTPGVFRALLGENGAGKSTLVKCIMGTYRSDTGHVRVGAHDTELKNPRQAHALGIGMVYQHFTLVDNMTVVENMVMAREHVPAIINWKRETQQLAAFMERMPFRVDPRARVRDLSAGEKQKVEILKQLFLHRKVMILDEPTSVLTPGEADEVLGMLRGMCSEGRLSILMISHKFREVMAFCDEVSVLRQDRLTGGERADEGKAVGRADDIADLLDSPVEELDRPGLGRIPAEDSDLLEVREMLVDGRGRGQADRLADVPHRRRIPVERRVAFDEVEYLLLTLGQVHRVSSFVGTWVPWANMCSER